MFWSETLFNQDEDGNNRITPDWLIQNDSADCRGAAVEEAGIAGRMPCS
ncbi:MAG: hypothetical protein HGA84_01935 [Syntrophobacteraceae bacterium]|nr:hypothetical protein [Syntrophobacteraceae bacterium]